MPRINAITSRECRHYLNRGGDLIYVPLGAHERLGPHLPLGARCLIADAIAMLLADQNDGLCLPLIPYGTVYDTYALRGSIDVDPGIIHQYVTDLCDELIANHFRRIIFVSFQEELYYLEHEYFQNKNHVVAWLSPDKFFEFSGTAAKLDRHGRELWRLAACLHASGQDEMLDKIWSRTGQYFNTYRPIRNISRENLDKLGNTGHKMQENEWMIYPVNLGEGLVNSSSSWKYPEKELVEKARSELLDWLKNLKESISALSEYQDFLDTHPLVRPQ
jgi:hypothetical protein